MKGQVSWIRDGLLDVSAPVAVSQLPQREHQDLLAGHVRVTTGDLGTEIKWIVESPCIASLLRAVHQLERVRSPIILRFHAFGWFEEIYRDSWNAVRRIEEILARGDRHFFSRAFVREYDPGQVDLPPIIKKSWAEKKAVEEFAVDCTIEGLSNNFVVDRIGPMSLIGRVWGPVTSSFPCQATSKFGDAVSGAYEKVLHEGKPHYDQVIAALRFPDNEVRWLPYHRAIFPNRGRGDAASVKVVAEAGAVDIKIL